MMAKTFTIDDQMLFAEFSGDYNPLHTDPELARRSAHGKPVVHGIALVLWALNTWLGDNHGPVRLTRLKVSFRNSVLIDQKVTFSLKHKTSNSVKIALDVNHAAAVEMDVSFTSAQIQQSAPLPPAPAHNKKCQALTKQEMETASGNTNLYLDNKLLKSLYPHLSARTPDVQTAAIAATSRILGMECPGLHAVYYGCDLTFKNEANAAPSVQYKVVHYDSRFSLYEIQVESSVFTGALKVFYRAMYYRQPEFSVFSGMVSPNEFRGQRALIIGGSRGLGEVSAKLLAAGGADVQITYHRGKADAERIASSIMVEPPVTCLPFDVLNIAADTLPQISPAPTHLYYFATPAIFAGKKNLFSNELFQKFCDYYVTGFTSTVRAMQSMFPDSQLRVFYPSTVAVEDMPTDMGEYSAAKAAGMSVCRFLEKTDKHLTTYAAILPRLATDQTVTILSGYNKDPLPVMLNHLRIFRDL